MSNHVQFNKLESYTTDKKSVRVSFDTRQFGIWQTKCLYSNHPAGMTDSFEKSNYEISEYATEPSINMFTKSQQKYIKTTAGLTLVTVFQDLLPDYRF